MRLYLECNDPGKKLTQIILKIILSVQFLSWHCPTGISNPSSSQETFTGQVWNNSSLRKSQHPSSKNTVSNISWRQGEQKQNQQGQNQLSVLFIQKKWDWTMFSQNVWFSKAPRKKNFWEGLWIKLIENEKLWTARSAPINHQGI